MGPHPIYNSSPVFRKWFCPVFPWCCLEGCCTTVSETSTLYFAHLTLAYLCIKKFLSQNAFGTQEQIATQILVYYSPSFWGTFRELNFWHFKQVCFKYVKVTSYFWAMHNLLGKDWLCRASHIEAEWFWGVEGSTFFELWCIVASGGLDIWV